MKRQGAHHGGAAAPMKRHKKSGVGAGGDPSLQYIKWPTRTPMIDGARSFFSGLGPLPFEFKVYCGDSYGWRSIAKLAVRGTLAPGQRCLPSQSIGLFAPGTHKITPCLDSPVHHPSINRAAKLVERCCVSKCVSGYREDTSSGLLRYLILAVEMSTGRVQLTLVCNCEPQRTSASEQRSIDSLVQALVEANANEEPVFHSIWVHSHPASRHDNAITGRLDGSWHCVFGEPQLRVCMELDSADVKIRPLLHFPPNVFRQANLKGFACIIDAIRAWIPAKSKVCELYGGVGTIGLNCLDLCKKLECSDENPFNEACFNSCVDELVVSSGKKKYRKRAAYLHASASERAQQGVFSRFDLLIVDPPRKGLDDEVVQALLDPALQRLSRLVYVSCGFKGFKADCGRLLEHHSASWRLVHAEGHVLFPGSDHIETLAIFERKV